MNELVSCIEHVSNMMSKSESTKREDVRNRIIRLFEEGVGMKQIVNLLIARQHVKHDEKILGLRGSDILTIDDLNEVEKTLGLNEISSTNRELWAAKFKAGKAKHWCPQCGYAGNTEFKSVQNGTEHLICYLCGFFEDARYFTRTWTPEQQAAFETERHERRAASEAKRIADKEIRRRQKDQSVTLHAEAVKAAQAIDLFLDDDPESYAWDDEASGWMVRRLEQLMLRAAILGVTVTGHELSEYFKSNLHPPDDYSLLHAEFDRVVAKYAMKWEGL